MQDVPSGIERRVEVCQGRGFRGKYDSEGTKRWRIKKWGRENDMEI